MDISPFMTLLQREDTDVWLAESAGRAGWTKDSLLVATNPVSLIKTPRGSRRF